MQKDSMRKPVMASLLTAVAVIGRVLSFPMLGSILAGVMVSKFKDQLHI